MLHVRAVDGHGAPVLDVVRATSLGAPGAAPVGAGDGAAELEREGRDRAVAVAPLAPRSWRLDPLRANALGPLFEDLRAGDAVEVDHGHAMQHAPALLHPAASLASSGLEADTAAHGLQRVHDGTVLSTAAAQVVHALPDLATILTWTSCTHLGPAYAGDRLRSLVEIEACRALHDGGIVELRIRTSATGVAGADRAVLDWRLTALMP